MIILSRIMMSLIGDIDLLIILINYALLVLVVSLLFSTEFSFFLLGSSRENQTKKKKKNNKGRNGNKNKNAPKRKKQNQTILNFSPTNLDSIHLLLMTILYVGRINHSIFHFFVLFCFFFILPRRILFTNDGIVPVDPILSDT